MASGNNNGGSDKPSSINNLRVIDGNDNLKTSKAMLEGVFTRGKETEPFSWEMLSRECLKHRELYQQRLDLVLENCSSENLNDKSVERLLILLNCFDLQKSLESTQDITKLKVAVLTGNYECIRKLIDDKINKIDINSQEAFIYLLDIIQVIIVGVELLFVCALDPIKKSDIKKELTLIEGICEYKLLALVESHLNGFGDVKREEVQGYIDYIVNLTTYCDAIMFSGFSTDPSQSKALVKEKYETEKNKLKSIKEFFKSNQNNQSFGGLLDLSQDRFSRNHVFLDTYLDLLYLKFKERTFYNIDCQNDKEKFNIEETFRDQQKAIILLLHSYTQVAGYENGDKRVVSIGDKIDLLQSVGGLGIRSSNSKMSADNIEGVMLVVDEIFEDFLENLRNDHYAIGELFLVISSIVHFVTFKDAEKIRKFQNEINNIIEEKKITGEGFYYQTGALNFGDTMMEIAVDNKKMIELMASLSVTDSLTGISNRLQFDRDFTIELIKVARESNEKDFQSNKWVFSLDIDYFKTINDKYGHDVGDIVLKEFTKVITSEIRSTDRFYRIGGEEFMILCECGTQEDAFVFGEKILNAVEFKLSNTLRRLEIFKAFDEEKVTMSVGAYNIVNEGGYSADNVPEFSSMCFKKVDEALYKTKNNGRNGITIDEKYIPRDEIKNVILSSKVSNLKTVV